MVSFVPGRAGLTLTTLVFTEHLLRAGNRLRDRQPEGPEEIKLPRRGAHSLVRRGRQDEGCV